MSGLFQDGSWSPHINRWSWFCVKTNLSYDASLPGAPDGGQIPECIINFVILIVHLIFIIVAILVLICCSYVRRIPSFLFKWPGHTIRWILTALVSICALASIGEGALTEVFRNEARVIQLQFHLPASMVFVATAVSLIYYQLAEFWRTPRLCWLLICYWSCCIGVGVARITMLFSQNVDINVAILWITILMVILYLFLLMLDLKVIALKVCNNLGGEEFLNRSNVSRDRDMKYKEDFVPFMYYITFWWMNWLFKLGSKRPLDLKDLGHLPENHRAQHLYQIFKEDFQKESDYKYKIGQNPSVWNAFGRVYKGEIFYAGLTRLIYDIACLIGPLTLNGIVAYATVYGQSSEVESHQYVTVQEFFSNGFILVGVIFISNIIQYFSYQQNLYLSNLVGVHIRTSLQTMVYDKSLRLSSYAISGGSLTVGQITNHMSADAFNMLFFSQKMHMLWSIPFRFICVVVLMYMYVGLATFAMVGVLLLCIPFQMAITRLLTKKQKIVMKMADKRLRSSNEMLLGMKLLKLYGWEEMFCNTIETVRKMEMSAIFKSNSCYCINTFVVQCIPILMNLSVFASYPYITGKTLEPSTTFAALSLMNLLLETTFLVPLMTALLVNAFVAARRLQSFFTAPETERSHQVAWTEYFSEKKKRSAALLHGVSNRSATPLHDVKTDEHTPLLNSTDDYESTFSNAQPMNDRPLTRSKENYAIKIQNGNFTWGSEGSEPVLKDINLTIPNGEVTMVVGAVGSGKSSLLSAILGEMTTVTGSVTFDALTHEVGSTCFSGVAYGAQNAWLMNASLRDNVLFGQPFYPGRYRKVIEACALTPDIDILPGGDMTEIGEKGINMSGGQKQRVSVARTMYSKKPVVLLDDPLSALDVNVGGHLFYEGIVKRLRKAHRTVVLVTHQLQYLQLAEKIVVMKEGRISFQGTFDEMAREDPELYTNWKKDVIAASESEVTSGVSASEESAVEERESLRKQVSSLSRSGAFDKSESNVALKADTSKTKLIQKEELIRGSVSAKIYRYYFRNAGWLWALLVPFARMTFEAVNVSRNFWLSDWSEAGLTNQTVDEITTKYLGPYIGLACVCFVVSAISFFCLLIATWNAAKSLYLRMLRNITRTPNRFFDTTPIGRILNRFSSDTQIIDSKLIFTFGALMNFFWTLLFAIIVNCIITPVFLAEVIPIIIVYAVLAVYFIRSSRELQRLDSVSKSPVFGHISETLGGLTTIRAFRDQKRFFTNLLKRIDTNNTAFLYLQAGYGWVGLQMSICGGFVVLMVALTTLLGATVYGNIDSSSVGLALSYVLLVSAQLFQVVRFAADTEMQMNPVERVSHYATVPNEDYYGYEPPFNWPHRGEIVIENVSVRYAENLPPVLKDVSLYVQPGEKVGVCGRTGSGKSSLTLALFRLIQTYKGRIIIDGENIADLPLTTLRQRLSIIPQDPVLFTGSIRSNLDPEGTRSETDLWRALEIAQLKTLVSESAFGLDALVAQGGENFSVGQRQLFCLARAFLRKSSILIMDEATASIDYDTEKLLQKVVSSVFKDITVLTIAHRVSTIRDADTIWVLRDGEVIECDSPENLLARETSEFFALVQANK